MFTNIIWSCRSVDARGRHFVVIPPHHCRTPSHHFGTSHYILAHFDEPYPHISSHQSHHILLHHIRTFWRTKPAHFVAPYPHISLHRTTRHSCKTGFNYETEFSCKTGYNFQNEEFSCETGFSCKAGVKEKKTHSRRVVGPRCCRPQLFDGFDRLLKY